LSFYVPFCFFCQHALKFLHQQVSNVHQPTFQSIFLGCQVRQALIEYRRCRHSFSEAFQSHNHYLWKKFPGDISAWLDNRTFLNFYKLECRMLKLCRLKWILWRSKKAICNFTFCKVPFTHMKHKAQLSNWNFWLAKTPIL
jgi:hypothetical protein